MLRLRACSAYVIQHSSGVPACLLVSVSLHMLLGGCARCGQPHSDAAVISVSYVRPACSERGKLIQKLIGSKKFKGSPQPVTLPLALPCPAACIDMCRSAACTGASTLQRPWPQASSPVKPAVKPSSQQPRQATAVKPGEAWRCRCCSQPLPASTQCCYHSPCFTPGPCRSAMPPPSVAGQR